MDHCFENPCEVNESMIVDYHKNQENKIRVLRSLVTVFGVLLIVRVLIGLLEKHNITSFGIVTMVVNIFAFYFLYCSPSVECKRAVRQFREFSGGQSAELTYWFADTVQVSCNGKMMEFEYKQIMGFDFWEDYLVLTVPRKTILFIAKDSFTKGTFEEFKQFLHKKCPNAQILK